MKSITRVLFAITITSLLVSCQSEHGTENDQETNNEQEAIPEVVVSNYELEESSSTINWTRTLDQKSMKRTMKIFGADVEVDMDAVTLNMNGEVDPVEGSFVVTDDLYDNGDLKFDMKTFKFAKEKGNGLFDVKSYPTSTLKFLSFEEIDSENFTAKCELTIQEHTEEIDFPVTISKENSDLSVQGSFEFNTLSFPLRDPNQEAEINKDVISVQLDLKYLLKN